MRRGSFIILCYFTIVLFSHTAFMRKCCADNGCPEPSERAVNQTFSHQVNYARRRLKPTNIQSCAVDTKSKQCYNDQKNGSIVMMKKELDESEKYIQM